MTRSRRAIPSRDQERNPPLYARVLGLKHLEPSGFLCFAFLEGAIVLGVLLALAELVSWWGVLVLPLTVAAMVKLNDVVAGVVSDPATPAPRVASSAAAGWGSSLPEAGRDPFAENPWSEEPQTLVVGPPLRSAVASQSQTDAGWEQRTEDDMSLGLDRAIDQHRYEVHGWNSVPSATAVHENVPAGPASSALWADQLDTHLQRERQSATRRYE